MKFEIPVKTVSESNQRIHWAVKAKRSRHQRSVSRIVTRGALVRASRLGDGFRTHTMTITITRIAPGTLDSDNLASSQKAVRDGIADALCVDDGSPLITWIYSQRRGKPREYSVEVKIA
jgi:hypothetical protein